MPMLKLKTIIDKMEKIEDSAEFDGWDAWIELKDWFVKQKPPEADGLANWDDAEHSVHPTVATGCPFCGVSAEDIELLNESLASDRNSG